MKAQGDSAAETCKNIIERAVVRKVNLVRELVSEQGIYRQADVQDCGQVCVVLTGH
jgi:hypothetical protein